MVTFRCVDAEEHELRYITTELLVPKDGFTYGVPVSLHGRSVPSTMRVLYARAVHSPPVTCCAG